MISCFDRSTRARNPVDNGETCPTLLAAMGTGGGNDPFILALDGDKWKYRPNGNYARSGGNGFGINEDCVMYTITSTDRHIVAILK